MDITNAMKAHCRTFRLTVGRLLLLNTAEMQ